MRQWGGSAGSQAAARQWLGRFYYVLLVGAAIFLTLIGKADTLIVSQARMVAIDVLAPVLSALSQPIASVRNLAADLQTYLSLHEENVMLARQNEALRDWQRVAHELQAQNDALRQLLNFAPNEKARFITAPVIADTTSSFARSVIVSAGREQGVAKGQAAMTGAGLAGRVLEAGGHSARVLLLTDINARVPVIIERTRDQAVLAGNNSEWPGLLYLPPDADVAVGDRIVTSGTGGNFPPALPVGEIAGFENGQALVKLFVNLQRLEYLRLVDYRLPGILDADGMQDSVLDPDGRRLARVTPPALGNPAIKNPALGDLRATDTGAAASKGRHAAATKAPAVGPGDTGAGETEEPVAADE